MTGIPFDDFKDFVKNESSTAPGKANYIIEWYYAHKAGWDVDDFKDLYIKYLSSIQATKTSHPKVSMLDLKGRPLEELAHYYLRRGGIVLNIKELNAPGRWQVDGQGLLNKDAIFLAIGAKEAAAFGPQLYMEAKNHKKSIPNNDYSHHLERMKDHDCRLGVAFSTSGYSISAGKGIARKIYEDTIRGYYSILFTVDVFKRVLEEDIPPLLLMREAYTHAINEDYENDPGLRKRYGRKECQEIAKQQYDMYC